MTTILRTPPPARPDDVPTRRERTPRRTGVSSVAPLVLSASVAVALGRLTVHGMSGRVLVPLVVAIVIADVVTALALRVHINIGLAVALGWAISFCCLLVTVDPSVVDPGSPHFLHLSIISGQLRAGHAALANDGTPLPAPEWRHHHSGCDRCRRGRPHERSVGPSAAPDLRRPGPWSSLPVPGTFGRHFSLHDARQRGAVPGPGLPLLFPRGADLRRPGRPDRYPCRGALRPDASGAAAGVGPGRSGGVPCGGARRGRGRGRAVGHAAHGVSRDPASDAVGHARARGRRARRT